MTTWRVQVLCEHDPISRPFPCAYIRILLPLAHPSNAGAFDVRVGYAAQWQRADIVVVERIWRSDVSLAMAEQVVERIRRDRACLIYAIDDNLLDLERITTEQKMVVRHCVREADGILVSTPRMKARLTHLNRAIWVLPNAVDERLFSAALGKSNRRQGRKRPKVIGYMGTGTHDLDMMMILEPLRAVLRSHRGEVELHLVGGIHESTARLFRDLPLRILRFGQENEEYPRFIPWLVRTAEFDLAVAPLEETAFNRCKSDLKFLDYSALRVAGIYSRIAPYDETVRHLETGYLVENTPEAWREALERMLAADALRENIASRAQQYVFSARTLQHRALQWKHAIEEIWNQFSLRKHSQCVA